MAAKKTETKADNTTETINNVEGEDLVEITIPEDFDDSGENFYCGVNGTAMFIPKGIPVKIPRRYAEAARLTLAMKAAKVAKAKADRAKANGIINTTM